VGKINEIRYLGAYVKKPELKGSSKTSACEAL